MVKHIVMWQLHEEALGNDAPENARQLRIKLEALLEKIPGLLNIEVGFNERPASGAGDVVLYSELENWEALKTYQAHPEHQAVIPFVKAVCADRRVVDYEI